MEFVLALLRWMTFVIAARGEFAGAAVVAPADLSVLLRILLAEERRLANALRGSGMGDKAQSEEWLRVRATLKYADAVGRLVRLLTIPESARRHDPVKVARRAVLVMAGHIRGLQRYGVDPGPLIERFSDY